MRTVRLKFSAYTLLYALAFLVAAVLLAVSLVQFHPVQQWLIERLSAAVGYEISSGPVNFSFWRGLALDAHDVTVESPETSLRFEGEHVKFVLDPGELLKGRIVPTQFGASGVDLTMPDLPAPVLDPSGISSEILGVCINRLLHVPPVSLKEIRIKLGGRKVFFEGGYFESGFNGQDRGSRSLSAGGIVGFDETEVPFSISGQFERAADEKEDLFSFDLDLQISELKAAWVRDFHGLSFTQGTVNVRASGKGTVPGGFSFDTSIETAGLKGFYTRTHRRFSFYFPGFMATLKGRGTEDFCDINYMNLSTPEWSLTGEAAVELTDRMPEAFSISLNAPFMPYEEFKNLVPAAYLPGWLSEKILNCMSGGEVRVDRFGLEGTFHELRKFKFSNNPAFLSLMLTWKGIKYEVLGAEIPFEEVSGRLKLQEGNLEISDVSGTFGASGVHGGGFTASPVWKPERYLAVVGGDFELGDLYHQQNMFFVPERVRNALAPFDFVQGTTAGSIHAEFIPGNRGLRLLKADLSLADCGFAHRDLPLPVQGARGAIDCQKKGNIFLDATGFLGNSELSISGSLSISGGLQAKVEGLADVNELIGRTFKLIQPPVRFSGKVPFSGSLVTRNDRWSADGELSLKDLGVHGENVSMLFEDAAGRMSFKIGGIFGQSLQISSAEARFGRSSLNFTGAWGSTMPGKLDLQVSSEYFNTSDAGVHIHALGDAFSGILAGNLDLGISPDADIFMLKGAVTGEIESSIDVFQGFFLSGCSFSLGFDNRSVAIEYFRGIAVGGAFNISGNLEGWKRWSGELSVHVRDMNTAGLFSANTKAATIGSETGMWRFVQEADLGLSCFLERTTWNRMLLDRVKVESRLKEGILHLDSYNVLWDHGSIKGSGSVLMHTDPEMHFSGDVEMKSQPLETLLYGSGSAGELLSGDLTMEAVFSTGGRTRKELIKGLSGEASLLMTEGVIRETRVLFQVLERLSLQQIFSGRPDDVRRGGFYFERIEAAVFLSGGIAQIESAVMRSPVFNSTGTGAIDLFNGRVEGDMHVQPLGSVDALVSRIPLLGYILAGEESTVLIYRFKVSGKISDPVVEYVPLKDLGMSAAGYIKRMLLTPGRVFRAFSDALTGDENEQ